MSKRFVSEAYDRGCHRSSVFSEICIFFISLFGYRIKQSVTESILAENISPKNVPYHPCQGLILGGFFNYFEQKWQNVTYATPN